MTAERDTILDKPIGLTFGSGLPLEGIPSAKPCVVCGDPTQKALLACELDADTFFVQITDAPGYVCPQGHEVYDPDTMDQLIELAGQELKKAGDEKNAHSFEVEAQLRRNRRTEKASERSQKKKSN